MRHRNKFRVWLENAYTMHAPKKGLGIIPLDEEQPYRHPQRSSACTETRHTTYTL